MHGKCLCGNEECTGLAHAAQPSPESGCSRCVVLQSEIENLRQALDYQNMPNRREPLRGGCEFYINEEWTGIKDAALGTCVGFVANLAKTRFDPDDERVRVRRIKDDDAILEELIETRRQLEILKANSDSPSRGTDNKGR